MTPVIKLAANRERTAAQAVVKARRQLRYYENKLDEMRGYREEYRQALGRNKEAGMSTLQLQEYQNFMRQLEEGIRMLSNKVQEQKRLNLNDERQWVMARQRTDILDKLIVKIKWMERKFHNNRLDNELDDRFQHQKAEI